MDGLDDNFRKNFMGFGENQVRFLGHDIGLVIDEMPVIAEKFKDPLEENMTLAIEPKKGIKGVGMVGVENTFNEVSGWRWMKLKGKFDPMDPL